MLEIIKEPSELDVSRFGLCEIVDTFLPHIKLESNDPYIVLYSLQILDKFSYLCDVHELVKLDLINQIEQILIVLVDINENRKNPKLYYKNFTKEIISGMLNSISYIISNTIAEYDDKDIENEPYYLAQVYRKEAQDTLDGIRFMNEKLGFSSALYKKMMQTTSLMGRQTEENGQYRISWTYHPDKGLEVMYERK